MADCEASSACVPATSGCDTVAGYPFQNIRVFPTIRFGTRLEWTLSSQFLVPGPYSFQLETALHDVATATDWEIVGSAVTEAAYLADDSRQYNSHHRRHYRIRLSVGADSWVSRPVFWQGLLTRQNRIRAKEIFRNYDKQFRLGGLGMQVHLLKKKIVGQPCTDCGDFQLGESTDMNCETCYGTKLVGGYWKSPECIWAQLSPEEQHVEDTDDANGTVLASPVRSGRFLAVPTLDSQDIIVIKNSDMRYAIRSQKVALELDGVPLVYDQVLLAALPFTSVIYKYPVQEDV